MVKPLLFASCVASRKPWSRVLLATKPQRRALFVQLLALSRGRSCRGLLLADGPLVFRLGLVSSLGGLILYFVSRALVSSVPDQRLPVFPLFNLLWVTGSAAVSTLFRVLSRRLIGVRFGWGLPFFVEGYHFRLTHARIRRLSSRAVVLGRLGFFRNLLFLFPAHVRFFWRKRSFFVRGVHYSEFRAVCKYLRFVRNLFPYKLKGLVYDNYMLNRTLYEQETFPLKPGKKDKQQR